MTCLGLSTADKGEPVATLIKDPLPGAAVPPILPLQDGYLFLDTGKLDAPELVRNYPVSRRCNNLLARCTILVGASGSPTLGE